MVGQMVAGSVAQMVAVLVVWSAVNLAGAWVVQMVAGSVVSSAVKLAGAWVVQLVEL